MSEEQKVTIIVQTEFGMVNVTEARLREHGRRQFAQYQNAPYAIFKAKRHKKYSKIVKGYKPYMIIIAGWNLGIDAQDSNFGPETVEGDMTVRRSRGTLFSGQNTAHMDAKINKMIENGEVSVVADYRDRMAEID